MNKTALLQRGVHTTAIQYSLFFGMALPFIFHVVQSTSFRVRGMLKITPGKTP